MCEEDSGGDRFSGWGPDYLSRLKRRESCSGPISMATVSGPTLFLVEVFCFLNEVNKGGKSEHRMRLLFLTLIPLQLHFWKSFSLQISMDSVSLFRHQITVLPSERVLSGAPDAGTEWHPEARMLMS